MPKYLKPSEHSFQKKAEKCFLGLPRGMEKPSCSTVVSAYQVHNRKTSMVQQKTKNIKSIIAPNFQRSLVARLQHAMLERPTQLQGKQLSKKKGPVKKKLKSKKVGQSKKIIAGVAHNRPIVGIKQAPRSKTYLKKYCQTGKIIKVAHKKPKAAKKQAAKSKLTSKSSPKKLKKSKKLCKTVKSDLRVSSDMEILEKHAKTPLSRHLLRQLRGQVNELQYVLVKMISKHPSLLMDILMLLDENPKLQNLDLLYELKNRRVESKSTSSISTSESW